jgi:predicted nucleic acid-binding protein
MAANPLYFDTSYLVRLYLEDNGFKAVRKLAAAAPTLVSAWHGQAETIAALHRAYREGRFTAERYLFALNQFKEEQHSTHFFWCVLTDKVQARLEKAFQSAPSSTFLRSANALHLACAAEHGFKEVYSNDRHFLAAAPSFGLQGINVIDGNLKFP